jgi:hypothetical protein
VATVDIVADKVAIPKVKKSPIEDFLQVKSLNLRTTPDKQNAHTGADYVTTTPTDCDFETNYLSTKSIPKVIECESLLQRAALKGQASLIIASCQTAALSDAVDKANTRDLFGSDLSA